MYHFQCHKKLIALFCLEILKQTLFKLKILVYQCIIYVDTL